MVAQRQRPDEAISRLTSEAKGTGHDEGGPRGFVPGGERDGTLHRPPLYGCALTADGVPVPWYRDAANAQVQR